MPAVARLDLSSFNSTPTAVPPYTKVCTSTMLILLEVQESQIMVYLHYALYAHSMFTEKVSETAAYPGTQFAPQSCDL
jgi:hypothetical protein